MNLVEAILACMNTGLLFQNLQEENKIAKHSMRSSSKFE